MIVAMGKFSLHNLLIAYRLVPYCIVEKRQASKDAKCEV